MRYPPLDIVMSILSCRPITPLVWVIRAVEHFLIVKPSMSHDDMSMLLRAQCHTTS